MNRLRQMLSRRRRYDDISASIREHIAERAEELMDEGMPREKAEQAARREFGNVALLEERSREEWQWHGLESLLADLKFTLRRLRKSPGFAATVLLTLAIGIGANTAIFSVLNSVLLRPLPYPEPQQLVSLHLNAPGAPGLAEFRSELRLSASMYLTFAAHNNAFQSVGVWGPGTASITGIAVPEQVNAALVSGGVLETLNVPALHGQWLTAADQDAHGLGRVMLSYGYWQRRFGGDPRIVGRSISVNSQQRVIAGVMPRGFKVVNYDFDLLVPLGLDPTKEILAGFSYRGIARLRPGVSIPQANADVARLLNVWMDSWSNGPGSDPHWYLKWRITPALLPLKETVVGSIQAVLWVVMATIGVVMLIACTNVANLLLARASSRAQELAVRLSLGASRRRMVRHLLAESLLLSLLGSGAGLAIDRACAKGIENLTLPVPASIHLVVTQDWRLLWYSIGVVLVSAVLCGLLPALRAVRVDVNQALKREERQVVRAGNLRSVLVAGQLAISIVLLTTGFLFVHNLMRATAMDPGFDVRRTIWASMRLVPELYRDPDQAKQVALVRAALERLRALPGVESAAIAQWVPLNDNCVIGSHIRADVSSMPVLAEYECNNVGPDYFRTIGIPILRGREFTPADRKGSQAVVIVNETFARTIFGKADPVGHTITVDVPEKKTVLIVGIAKDSRYFTLGEKQRLAVYEPYFAYGEPIGLHFLIRTTGAPAGWVRPIAEALGGLDGTAAIETKPMSQALGLALLPSQAGAAMLGAMGMLGLILAATGLYGVLLYSVSRRTREIGLRVALGATPANVLLLVGRHSLVLVGSGTLGGLVLAFFAMQPLAIFLVPGLSALDPAAVLAVIGVLGAVAVVASLAPAVRALRIDPMAALRYE